MNLCQDADAPHQDVVRSGKNTLLGVRDSIIKVPAVGLSYTVDRLIRGTVQAALAAERARVAARDTPLVSKALVDSGPSAVVAMEE